VTICVKGQSHFTCAPISVIIRLTVTPSPESVGERLRRIREEKGLSQRALARLLAGRDAPLERVESERRQLIEYEKGRIPEDPSAIKLARALDQPDDIFVSERLSASGATLAQLNETARLLAEATQGLIELLAEQRSLAERMSQIAAVLERREAASGGEEDTR